MDRGGHVAQPVLDPAVEDAGFPGLVEGGFAEGGGGGVAGRPGVAAVGGGEGWVRAHVGWGGGEGVDDRVDEDEGGEEAWVEVSYLDTGGSLV